MTQTPFTAHLRPGETLLWQGGPGEVGIKPAREDIIAGLWGLGTLALLVSLLWIAGVFHIIWPVTVLVALPLVAILVLSFYQLLLKHRLLAAQSRRALYALTNRRAMVLTKAQGGRLFALEIRPGTEVALNDATLSLWHWPGKGNKEAVPEEIHFPFLADGQTPYAKAREIVQEMS